MPHVKQRANKICYQQQIYICEGVSVTPFLSTQMHIDQQTGTTNSYATGPRRPTPAQRSQSVMNKSSGKPPLPAPNRGMCKSIADKLKGKLCSG